MKNLKPLFPFFTAYILFMAISNFAHPVTPTLITMYGLPANTFGVAFAAMCFMNFLFSPFWGKINNHIHTKTTLTICCAGYALGQLFFLMAHDRTGLILARAFSGIFTGGCFTSFFAYIVHHTDDEMRGPALTFYATSQIISSAVGFFIGGWLGEIHVMAGLWTQVIGEALVAAMFFFALKKENPLEKTKAKIGEIARTANPFAAFYAGRHFLNATWVLLLIVCMFEYMGYVGFDQSFNYFLKGQFDFSSSVNGNLKLVISVATFLANATVCKWLMSRTNIRKSVITMLLLLAISMAAFCCFSTAFIPLAVITVLFFTLDCITVPLLQNIVADEIKRTGGDNNLIMGFYNSLRFFGAIFGGLCSGYLYDVTPVGPFVMFGSVFAAAALLAFFFMKKTVVRTK